MAVWTTAYKNRLPDECFLYIQPSGKKDTEGKTVPRDLRMFPYKDAEGKIDLPHLQNAASRIPQADISDALKARLLARVRNLLKQQKPSEVHRAELVLLRLEEVAQPAPALVSALVALRQSLGRSRELLLESQRIGGLPLEEAGLVGGFPEVGSGRVIENCTIIRAGLNATGQRYWPADLLKTNVQRFAGAMCHIDHPTATEAVERPERSLTTLAARVENPRFDEREQAVKGDVRLVDTTGGDFVERAFKDPIVRETAGLSIRWPHRWLPEMKSIPGTTNRVQHVAALIGPPDAKFGVDFVTTPTAGGKVGRFKGEN